MLNSQAIIRVRLKSNKQEYFFGSLVALFLLLDHDQVGTTLKELYRHEEFKRTGKFKNEKCSLKRVEVFRANQKCKPG